MSAAIHRAAEFVTNEPVLGAVLLDLLEEADDSELRAMIECVATSFMSTGRVSALREATVIHLLQRESSPLARLRQTSISWKVLMASLEADHAFSALVKEMQKPLSKICNQKARKYAFLRKDDGREVVAEHRLLRATSLLLKHVLHVLSQVKSRSWVASVLEVQDLFMAARGEGTPEELSPEVVVSSLFFLRLLCPALIEVTPISTVGAISSSRRKRVYVWLSKSIMKAVASALEGSQPPSGPASTIRAHIDGINKFLLSGGAREVAPPTPPSPSRISSRCLARVRGLLQVMLSAKERVEERLASYPEVLYAWQDHALALEDVGFEARFSYKEVWERLQRKGTLRVNKSAYSRSSSCLSDEEEDLQSTLSPGRMGSTTTHADSPRLARCALSPKLLDVSAARRLDALVSPRRMLQRSGGTDATERARPNSARLRRATSSLATPSALAPPRKSRSKTQALTKASRQVSAPVVSEWTPAVRRVSFAGSSVTAASSRRSHTKVSVPSLQLSLPQKSSSAPLSARSSLVAMLQTQDEIVDQMYSCAFSDVSESEDESDCESASGSLCEMSDLSEMSSSAMSDDESDATCSESETKESEPKEGRAMVLKATLGKKVKLVRVTVTPMTTEDELAVAVAQAFGVPRVSLALDVVELYGQEKPLRRVAVALV